MKMIFHFKMKVTTPCVIYHKSEITWFLGYIIHAIWTTEVVWQQRDKCLPTQLRLMVTQQISSWIIGNEEN
jgi:hypothetical protein